MKKIWTPRLVDILPDSVLLDPKLRASAQAIDTELAKLSLATRDVLHLPRLDELSGAILDHLAEQFHVDFYEPLYLSDEEKRNLIRTSIAWHRIKGTAGAVEQIANMVFRDAEVEEWYEYGGEPYRFKIKTNGYKETPDGFATFLRMIDTAKNVRSWLDDITLDYSEQVAPLNLYLGMVEAWQGHKAYGLTLPTENYAIKLNAGVILSQVGEKGGAPLAIPHILFDNKQKLQIGQVLIRGGSIIINADMRDLRTYDDIIESGIADLLISDVGLVRDGEIPLRIETYDTVHKTNFYTGIALDVSGIKALTLPKPTTEPVRLFANVVDLRQGEISIATDTTRKFEQKIRLNAGVGMFKTGIITIDSETRPTIGNARSLNLADNVGITVGVGFDKIGLIKLGMGAQYWHEHHKAIIRVVGGLIRSGEIIITAAENYFPDIADFLDGEYLRIYFDFPTGRDKPMLIQNPRGDLLIGDIKEVGDVAVANDIFLNSRAENTTGIKDADLIKAMKLSSATDNVILPSSDQLRLYFKFPDGQDRRILLHNLKAGITGAQLREMGVQTANDRLLLNSRGQSTQGISHVALINNLKISAANANKLATWTTQKKDESS